MPVLDTDFLIPYNAGAHEAARALRRIGSQHLVVPFQAALEFGHGLPAGTTVSDDDLPGPVEPPDGRVLAAAVTLAQEARAAGRRARTGDLWIAAHATIRDDYVVSANKRHFRALGIPCWHWIDEEEPPAL